MFEPIFFDQVTFYNRGKANNFPENWWGLHAHCVKDCHSALYGVDKSVACLFQTFHSFLYSLVSLLDPCCCDSLHVCAKNSDQYSACCIQELHKHKASGKQEEITKLNNWIVCVLRFWHFVSEWQMESEGNALCSSSVFEQLEVHAFFVSFWQNELLNISLQSG